MIRWNSRDETHKKERCISPYKSFTACSNKVHSPNECQVVFYAGYSLFLLTSGIFDMICRGDGGDVNIRIGA
jgi:hypothetical protein